MANDAAEDTKGAPEESHKCEECVPGLPMWMGTFSDLVTLLLTFFVLLLSFAKTEVAKYEAALGSIRKAFGGNVLQKGEVLQPGKSPDDAPTFLESQQEVKPFPIEFLTAEGLLDKHEINRESTEQLTEMRNLLRLYELEDDSKIFELPEGIKVELKEKIFFRPGTTEIEAINVEVFEKVVKLVRDQDWVVFVEGHAGPGERPVDKEGDVYSLSADRAKEVAFVLIDRGVRNNKILPTFYGDSRPLKNKKEKSARVEFILRKRDLHSEGHEVSTR